MTSLVTWLMLRRTLLTASLLSATSRAMSSSSSLVGGPVPVFAATSHTGVAVTSESLAGTGYCIWFYPKADTGG